MDNMSDNLKDLLDVVNEYSLMNIPVTLSMKKLLDKFSYCDKFSLSGGICGYKITEEEFDKAFDSYENKDGYSSIKKEYSNCFSSKEDMMKRIPEGLESSFLYYEITFTNPTSFGDLIVNFYFSLDDNSKKYLLQYKNSFDIPSFVGGLDDLAFYKDNKIEYSSCTHEVYDSLKFDYKEMSKDEIIDLIKDNVPIKVSDNIFDCLFKIIKLDEGSKFSFRELGISNRREKNIICSVSHDLNLKLIGYGVETPFATINPDGTLNKSKDVMADLCSVDDIITKVR